MNTTACLKTEILAVGTELLTPSYQDRNSLYLIERLNELGIDISFRTIVADDRRDLLDGLRTALRRSHLIIATGGLGPTEDDRTREAVAEVLGRKLVFQESLRKRVRERFRRRGVPMPASNLKQCYVIEDSEVLENRQGTAPGLWIEAGSRRLILLPGPPRELEPMFENTVLPRLEGLKPGFSTGRVLKITGLSESMMEDKIRDVYGKLPPGGNITTLASPGDIEIRLKFSSRGKRDAEQNLGRFERRLLKKLGNSVYSRSGESLEEAVGTLLKARGKTVSCAESCSGGLLSHRLTNVAGSSRYFLEGIIAYSNQAKTELLAVSPSVIRKEGAVSPSAARIMAVGALKRAGSDFGLAITGIAGPGGGTTTKPVGLVYTALAHGDGVAVEKNLFSGSREIIKFQASQKALDMLRRRLLRTAKGGVSNRRRRRHENIRRH